MLRLGPALLVSASLVVALTSGQAPADPGNELHARASLAPPGPPPPPPPSGRMDVEMRAADAHHAAFSRFRISVAALADTPYTMWADDPSTPATDVVQFASFTTGADGRAVLDYDTRDGDAMPFGASLADLAGKSVEMRNAADAAVLVGTIPVAAANGKPAMLHGRTDLARPVGSAFPDSAARLTVDVHPAHGEHAAWSRLRIELRGLAPKTTYALWGDDPATPAADLVKFGSVTTRKHGRGKIEFDTRRGDPLPFGASAADLGGKAVEIRDGADVALLGGLFPVPFGPPAPHRGPPLTGHGDLVPPGPPPPPPPSGKIDLNLRAADAHHAARSHLRISVERLAANATFTLWSDAPSTPDALLTQFGSVTTDANGRAAFDLDSKDGDPMPYGAALGDLAGRPVQVCDAGATVVLVGAFPALNAPPKPEPALHGKSDLTRPPGSTFPSSVGHVDVQVHPATPGRPEFSRLTIEVRGLAPFTQYALFGDDPGTADSAPAQFATVTTDKNGRAKWKRDTKKGDGLPFGASPADLGGRVLQVRDAADVVLLAGTFPTPQ